MGTQTDSANTQTNTVLQTVIHDLFVVGVAAASIFVKNPASQQKAGVIVNVLQELLPSL